MAMLCLRMFHAASDASDVALRSMYLGRRPVAVGEANVAMRSMSLRRSRVPGPMAIFELGSLPTQVRYKEA
jgi:hypothetical protein